MLEESNAIEIAFLPAYVFSYIGSAQIKAPVEEYLAIYNPSNSSNVISLLVLNEMLPVILLYITLMLL